MAYGSMSKCGEWLDGEGRAPWAERPLGLPIVIAGESRQFPATDRCGKCPESNGISVSVTGAAVNTTLPITAYFTLLAPAVPPDFS
jgi:hypothetical protein